MENRWAIWPQASLNRPKDPAVEPFASGTLPAHKTALRAQIYLSFPGFSLIGARPWLHKVGRVDLQRSLFRLDSHTAILTSLPPGLGSWGGDPAATQIIRFPLILRPVAFP